MDDWKGYLEGKGWTFDKICSNCEGGATQYSKREYWVKVFKGQIFKLYYKGQHTNTQPLWKLDETVKDI